VEFVKELFCRIGFHGNNLAFVLEALPRTFWVTLEHLHMSLLEQLKSENLPIIAVIGLGGVLVWNVLKPKTPTRTPAQLFQGGLGFAHNYLRRTWHFIEVS
jgi:hypothetical protein